MACGWEGNRSLASHWPRVTDISGSPPTGSRPRRGRWAPTYALVEHGWLYLYLMSAHCIAHVSQQFLHENCQQVLEKEQWTPSKSPNLNGMDWDIMSGEQHTKLFWNLHPKPKTVSESKVTLEKIWDNFLQVQLIMLPWVLRIARER